MLNICENCVNCVIVSNLNNNEVKIVCTVEEDVKFSDTCPSFNKGKYDEEGKRQFQPCIGGVSKTQHRKCSYFDYYEGNWR